MDTNTARQLLEAIVQEQRNWEAARLRTVEVLDAFDQARKETKDLEGEKAELVRQIQNLGAELEKGVGAMEREISRQRDALNLELEGLKDEIGRARKQAEEAKAAAKQATADANAAMARKEAAERDAADVEGRVSEARMLLNKLTSVRG